VQRLAGALTLLAVLSGCVIPQRDVPREMLDEKTGTTVTAMGTALEFYAARPEFGLQAASFAHLGAFELNQMGARRLLLWLSVLPGDSTGQVKAQDEPTSLVIRADDREYRPDLMASGTAQLGLSRTPFDRPAEWARDGYFDISIEELREFQAATRLTLAITTADGRALDYELWKPERDSLVRFIEKIATQ